MESIEAAPRLPASAPAEELAETTSRALDGARALVDALYHAINVRDVQLLRGVWSDDRAVQLLDPQGTVVRGIAAIAAVYRTMFERRRRLSLEFRETSARDLGTVAVFTGWEFGLDADRQQAVRVRIRATLVCTYEERVAAWRLLHYHGSIVEPGQLAAYQRARTFGSR